MAVVGVPLILTVTLAVTCDQSIASVVTDWASLLGRSVALAGGIAMMAVLLGVGPAHVLAHTRHTHWVLGCLILPLVLPRYVLYYAWTLLLHPTGALGQFMAHHPTGARVLGNSLTVGHVSRSPVRDRRWIGGTIYDSESARDAAVHGVGHALAGAGVADL